MGESGVDKAIPRRVRARWDLQKGVRRLRLEGQESRSGRPGGFGISNSTMSFIRDGVTAMVARASRVEHQGAFQAGVGHHLAGIIGSFMQCCNGGWAVVRIRITDPMVFQTSICR